MRPHDQSIRQEVIRLHFEENQSMSKIQADLAISYTSIRNWVKAYKQKGIKGLVPNYCGNGKSTIYSQQLIDKAIGYKKEHPDWGAPFILVKLADENERSLLPKARWLQKIFKREGLQPIKNKLPVGPKTWAKNVFDRVQVDAKEKLKTADGKACCYLNFVDEYSGSELDAFLFPLCSY